MPNWCSNTIAVSSESLEELNRFEEAVSTDEGRFTFRKLVPIEDGQKPDELWGTSLDAQEGELDLDQKEELERYYNFDTAWGPASKWFETIVPMFPELSFVYTFQEPSVEAAGRTEAKGGVITSDEWFDVGTTREYIRFLIDKGLDDDLAELEISYSEALFQEEIEEVYQISIEMVENTDGQFYVEIDSDVSSYKYVGEISAEEAHEFEYMPYQIASKLINGNPAIFGIFKMYADNNGEVHVTEGGSMLLDENKYSKFEVEI